MASKGQHFDPRQVMLREDFEIFHYREPKAAGVEIHHHDFYEIYLLLSGQVEFWVDGSLYKLEAGDIFLISPMELHRPMIDSKNQYERIVLWVNKDYLESFAEEGMDLAACFRAGFNMIRPAETKYASISARLMELVREDRGTDLGNHLAARGIFLQFMVELNRIAAADLVRQPRRRQGSKLIGKVLSFIDEHSSEPLSLDELAGRFYVSKYYLSHEFSRETGVSIYRYIMLKRLLAAKQLLSGGMSAGEACYKCGFKDYAGFYRAFKSEYGISPKTFADAQIL